MTATPTRPKGEARSALPLLGGAICAHVRIGELGSPPELISLHLGAMASGGLSLRDPRIRALLPLIR